MQQAQDRTQTQRQSTGPPALALACGETTSVPHLQQGASHTSLSSCRGQDDQGTAQHPRAKLQPVGDIQGQPGSSIGSLVADTAKHARPARPTPATGTARPTRPTPATGTTSHTLLWSRVLKQPPAGPGPSAQPRPHCPWCPRLA